MVLQKNSVLPFDQSMDQRKLDLDEKKRSNCFPWRGQFTPDLIKNIIAAYCHAESVILDPFVGSGTVVLEAVKANHAVFGFEVNPAAWIMSKVFELSALSLDERDELIHRLHGILCDCFPFSGLFSVQADGSVVTETDNQLKKLIYHKDGDPCLLVNALIVLLDIAKHKVDSDHIHGTFKKLAEVVHHLPISNASVKVGLADARNLPLSDGTVDFVLTSPPYINVFNYHQNYRMSVELLGWDLLRVAKSEIGSNRANRGNRFLTVVQYCIDMADVLRELRRVCKDDARLIFVVGYESKVLGVPFYNANIVAAIASSSGRFRIPLIQSRKFKNKFGRMIREELIHLEPVGDGAFPVDWGMIARQTAESVFSDAANIVQYRNANLLQGAKEKIHQVHGSQWFDLSHQQPISFIEGHERGNHDKVACCA